MSFKISKTSTAKNFLSKESPYLLVAADFVKTGGMDRGNFALADYLARNSNKVHLVTHKVAPTLLTYPNVIVNQIPKLLNSAYLSSPILDWVGRLQAQKATALSGRVLVNGGNCLWGDVNWVHYVHAVYQSEYRTNVLQKVKGKISHQQFLASERKALHQAKVIIANSERTKRDLIRHLQIPENRIHRVYYGIDSQDFYPATPEQRTELRQKLGWNLDKPIVMFIGALGDRRKGFDTVFATWQQLCQDPAWDADLIAIGVGAELPLWQKRVAETGLKERIQFLGFRSDVPDLLRAADCLVAPTRYEAYGLGVHEALCCALPALVSNTAGVAERYPNQLSELLLSDPDNPEELAAKLWLWRKKIHEYCIRVNSFSQELRSYTWDNMAEDILEKFAFT